MHSQSEKDESEPGILAEMEEKRTEISKTFVMDDGTFMVVQYDSPIHYETEDGVWEEISNSLEESQKRGRG